MVKFSLCSVANNITIMSCNITMLFSKLLLRSSKLKLMRTFFYNFMYFAENCQWQNPKVHITCNHDIKYEENIQLHLWRDKRCINY